MNYLVVTWYMFMGVSCLNKITNIIYLLFKNIAIKISIRFRFRHHVLKEKPIDDSSFLLTKVIGGKRRDRTSEELGGSLKQLVSDVCRVPSDGSESVLVGKRVRHRFEEGDPSRDVWYYGKVLSQVYIN